MNHRGALSTAVPLHRDALFDEPRGDRPVSWLFLSDGRKCRLQQKTRIRYMYRSITIVCYQYICTWSVAVAWVVWVTSPRPVFIFPNIGDHSSERVEGNVLIRLESTTKFRLLANARKLLICQQVPSGGQTTRGASAVHQALLLLLAAVAVRLRSWTPYTMSYTTY